MRTVSLYVSDVDPPVYIVPLWKVGAAMAAAALRAACGGAGDEPARRG